ncbi:hypothetical protein [Helicobacter sp. T3_23-1056]
MIRRIINKLFYCIALPFCYLYSQEAINTQPFLLGLYKAEFYNPIVFYNSLYKVAILSDESLQAQLQEANNIAKSENLDSIGNIEKALENVNYQNDICAIRSKGLSGIYPMQVAKRKGIDIAKYRGEECNDSLSNAINTKMAFLYTLYGIYRLEAFMRYSKICESMDMLFNNAIFYSAIVINGNITDEKYATYSKSHKIIYEVFFTLSKKASDKINEYEQKNKKCTITKATFSNPLLETLR